MIRTLSYLQFFVCCCVVFCSITCFAQQDLVGQLNLAKNDAERISILNQLATKETEQKNYEKAVLYGKQSLELANKTSDANLKGQSLRVIGRAYQGQNDFASSLDHYLQSVILFESTNDNKQLAEDHYDIAMLYAQRSAYQKSIDNLQKALSYYQKAADKIGEEKTLNKLGDSYLAIKDYPNATKFYSKAIES